MADAPPPVPTPAPAPTRSFVAPRLALVIATIGLLALFMAAPAVGHTQLTGSNPPSGSELRRAPEQVLLEFNEPISPTFARITLSRGSDEAENLVPRVDDRVVTAAVPAAPPSVGEGNTEWQVNYRVVSADGHPVAGTISFTAPGLPVEQTPPEQKATSTSSAEGSPSPTPTSGAAAPAETAQDDDDDVGLPAPLVALLLALAVGAIVVALRLRSERRAA